MNNLEQWVGAYLAMDDRRRKEMLKFAQAIAAAHPSKKTARLSLVSSGDGLGASMNLRQGHDASAPVRVCKVVKLK